MMPDGPQLSVLPGPEERIYAGKMKRRVISAKGIKIQTRYAVLSVDFLAFAR